MAWTMDDLSDRDLTGIADRDLSKEERGELRRRMDAFLGRMQIRRLGRPAPQDAPQAPESPRPRKRRLAAWKPKVLRRSP